MFMQIAISVCIFIEFCQAESRFQLAANLFFQGMGKLDSFLFCHAFLEQFFIPQWMKRQCIGDLCLLLIENVIDPSVKTA